MRINAARTRFLFASLESPCWAASWGAVQDRELSATLSKICSAGTQPLRSTRGRVLVTGLEAVAAPSSPRLLASD